MQTREDDIPPGRPFEIRLSEFVDGSGNPLTSFPAGQVTVLRTDSSPAASLLEGNVSNVYRPNVDALERIKDFRIFEGVTKDSNGDSGPYRVFPLLGKKDGRDGSSTTDYDTHVVIGNSAGFIDGFTALPIPFALSIQGDSASDFDTPAKLLPRRIT